MRPKIFAPAVLAHTFQEFETQLKKIDIGVFPYVHIDVMDGKFVPHTSFGDIERINELPLELPIELHFMVDDPIEHMEQWAAVNGIFRTIFHVESGRNLAPAMALASDIDLQVGLALNPDTSLSKLLPHLDLLDVVQFMTVYPGKQGAEFQTKVLEKITEFSKNREGILISADGAVSAKTVPELAKAGVDIFTVGSTFMQSPDVTKTLKHLQEVC